MRRALALTLRSAARTPTIHGLLEFDVTEPRRRIAGHRLPSGESISFTAFIVACVAAAVAAHPAIHAMRRGAGRIEIFDDVDVAVLVEREMDGRRQPIVPVIRAANRLGVMEIHDAIRHYQHAPVAEAWNGFAVFSRIPLPVFQLIWPVFWWLVRRSPRLTRRYRGTIDVTAVGMFGAGSGWAIPVASRTSVAVGGIGVRPVFVDGVVVPHEMLSVTLSFDHELVDGAVAARFANHLRQLVEAATGLPDGSPIAVPLAPAS